MIERITKNRLTTGIALVIFIVGVVALFTDKASLTEFGGFLVTALTFLFLKDPKKPTGGAVMKVVAFAITILALAALMSCSANWHLNQAIKKDSSLFDTTRLVTIDTTYIETPVQDTTLLNFQDSLVIRFKDSTVLEVRYHYKDSVMIRGVRSQESGDQETVKVSCKECLELCLDSTEFKNDPPDQVRIEEKDKSTVTVEVRPSWFWPVIVGLIALVLVLAYGLFRKRLTRL